MGIGLANFANYANAELVSSVKTESGGGTALAPPTR
jgi:hypothetical protein